MGKQNEPSSTATVRIESNNGFSGVFAARMYGRGDHLLPLSGRAPAQKSRYTIQIGDDLHLDPDDSTGGAPSPWKFLNHSCDPNLEIDLSAMCFKTRREVAAGEELTFNYLSTEWDMASPFNCLCGSPGCYGTIRGFTNLSPQDQERLLPTAAPHIQSLAHLIGARHAR